MNSAVKYFCIPLEQGLRQGWLCCTRDYGKYFCIPLEQGLRHNTDLALCGSDKYFSIPLEQGLRRNRAALAVSSGYVF